MFWSLVRRRRIDIVLRLSSGWWACRTICNLSIVIWDFSDVSGKTNRFYLNQLELTLTDPWLRVLGTWKIYSISLLLTGRSGWGFQHVIICQGIFSFDGCCKMRLLFCLLGLVFIVEGLPYLAFPDRMKKWLAQIQQVPDNQLRLIGFLAMCFGLVLTYIFREW